MNNKTVILALLAFLGGCVGGAASSYLNNDKAIAQNGVQSVDYIKTKGIFITDESGSTKISLSAKNKSVIAFHESGVVKMAFGISEGEPIITFADNYRNPTLILTTANGEPQMGFFKDKKKSMLVGLTKEGSVGMFLYDRLEKPRLISAVQSNGNPLVGIYSHNLKDLLGFAYENGVPYLQLQHNKKNRILMGLSDTSGNGGLLFLNKYGNTVVELGEDTNEGAYIDFKDKRGHSYSK